VKADPTNPRGFAESQWVVNFHTKLLDRVGVQVADARPLAWALTADVALSESVRSELRAWLELQFREADHLVIKDPRLSWFLPLWRSAAREVGATASFATALRHPAAVLESKQRSYGTWQSDVNRTAAWVNQSLFTERATRDYPRAFVLYQDLLDDWTRTIARVGDQLDLAVVRDAPAAAIVQVHEFVDRSLSRSRASWEDFEIPDDLQRLAEDVWTLLAGLAGDEALAESTTERLEAARAAYIELYEDAEAIAQSSIVAATKPGRARPSRAVRLARRVPKRYRSKVPASWRASIVRTVGRRGAAGP
jgi:hypothetical protein